MSPSNQRYVLEFALGGPGTAVATGSTIVLGLIPAPASIDCIQFAASGLSGSPTGLLILDRFIAGVGYTTFPIGTTFAIPSYGTSGVISTSIGVSLPQIGSTLTTLFPNDRLILQVGGTNAAFYSLTGGIVLRPIQDIIKYYNIV